MFTLAHISDPHLAPLPKTTPALLTNKRILGYLSWTLRRRHVHQAEVLARLGADLKQQRPDHIAVTGDITNISLPAEFEQAERWLSDIGPAANVSVVPGNHDAYVRLRWEASWSHWADYMAGVRLGEKSAEGGDSRERAASGLDDFPYVRRRGSLAIVGVSSACPTMPFSAAGVVGEAQMVRLDRMLQELGERGLFRVVLIHHPPLAGGAARRKQLRDNSRFREVVARQGAELVLHGHTHRSSLAHIEGPSGAHVPVIGVAAASAGREHKGKGLAQYHIYRIGGSVQAGWRLDAEVRALDRDLLELNCASQFTLSLPQ
jgi:3',5'-cyclic AMP phosphodiesterase CpdA